MCKFFSSLVAAAALMAQPEAGFVSLFDGKTLHGWQTIKPTGPGYIVEDGVILCPANGGGNLFTDKEYANFVVRFEFRMEAGGNNGLGIRAPLTGDAAYTGMELQILDDAHEKYHQSPKSHIKPEQHHGSIYGVFPARTGYLKPVGEWNSEEVTADGSRIKIKLNGVIIVNADLNDVQEEKVLKAHPGLRRTTGHIGFLGHGSKVEFRNIRIKALP